MRKIKLSKELSEEEKVKEAQLMSDLTNVEKYVGKEIWELEAIERAG